MDNIVHCIDGIMAFDKEKLKNENERILINNVNENLAAVLISSFLNTTKQNMLVVTANLFQAQKTYDKLVQVLGEEHVYFFPMDEFISAEMLASSSEFRKERINTAVAVTTGKRCVIVTHTIGLVRKLIPKDVFINSIKIIRKNEEYDF